MYELQQSNTEKARAGIPATSFAVGAIVGAGIALLLAPATGRDVRTRLGQTARKVGNGAKTTIGKARHAINGLKHDSQMAIDRGRETFARSRSPEPH